VGRQPGRSINHCDLARVTIADTCLSPLALSHPVARVSAYKLIIAGAADGADEMATGANSRQDL